MSLQQFLPTVVKELLKHVPSLVFEVTDWSGVRRDGPLMTARLFSRSGVSSLKKHQTQRIGQFIEFNSPPHTTQNSEPKEMGDALLRYYFAQLYCSDGIFLDLRPEHFFWNPKDKKLNFEPNGCWYQFSPNFRLGLLRLYNGFYLQDEDQFQQGLLDTRLINSEWPVADQNQMKQLFRNHFGASLDEAMNFNLTDFQNTFLKIFEFLMEKKVTLSSEFMLFGIYLVTLYLNLEQLGQKHEVRKLYLEVRTQLQDLGQ